MAEQRIIEMTGAHEIQSERSPFRSILPGEPKQGGDQSDLFFSPHEACRPGIVRARVAVEADRFFVARDHTTGKIVDFINGLSTRIAGVFLLAPLPRVQLGLDPQTKKIPATAVTGI